MHQAPTNVAAFQTTWTGGLLIARAPRQDDPHDVAVGTRTIASAIRREPQQTGPQAVADINFRGVDFRRLMASAGFFRGAGVVGRRAYIGGRRAARRSNPEHREWKLAPVRVERGKGNDCGGLIDQVRLTSGVVQDITSRPPSSR